MSLGLDQLRCTPHSSYYSSLFLLRTSVTLGGQPAVIEYTSGQLTLSFHYPKLSVAFPTISAALEDILRKYGVHHIGNFFCEDAPLYEVSFQSQYFLKKFLRLRSRLQSEVATLYSRSLSKDSVAQGAAQAIAPTCSTHVPTIVEADLFLFSPDPVKKDARVVKVTLENCSTCMALWKDSEVLDFGSIFRVYRLDRSTLPEGGISPSYCLLLQFLSIH